MSVDIDTDDFKGVQVRNSAMGIQDPTEEQVVGQIESGKFYIDDVRKNTLKLVVYDNNGYKINAIAILDNPLNYAEREDLRREQQQAFASD